MNTNSNKRKGVVKVNNSNSSKDQAQAQQGAKQKKMRLPLFRRLHIRPLYLLGGALVTILGVFFTRVAVWERSYLAAMEGSTRSIAAIELNEGIAGEDEVDSTEPTEQEVYEYIVAPDKPRYITIPYLNIHARVVEIGLKNATEMSTPYNIYDVGWYTGSGSVLPGESGVSVLNAHGGNLGYGIFRNLPKLPVGETIRIEMGDGRIFTYKVVESVTKDLGDAANQYMNTAFTPLNGTPNTLTLITCTGDWWESSQTYSQRLFVRAALQQ